MKKYFKVASESLFGKGQVYFEFDGEMAVRQVEHYGEKWFHLVTTLRVVMPPGRSASSDLNELPRVNRHQAALDAERGNEVMAVYGGGPPTWV